jgi:hypothetical protein
VIVRVLVPIAAVVLAANVNPLVEVSDSASTMPSPVRQSRDRKTHIPVEAIFAVHVNVCRAAGALGQYRYCFASRS